MYYLQLANVTFSGASLYGDNQIATLQGFYNAGGNSISLARLFNDNLADVTTANYGLFGELVDSTQPTVVTGLVLYEVNIRADLGANAQNFGLIAGKTDTNSIIANSYVYADITLGADSNVNIGGLVGDNSGLIIGSGVDLNITINGTGSVNFGGLAGKSARTNGLYTFIDDFAIGRAEIYNPNTTAGGLVGDNSGSALYARNTYTAMEINNYSNGTPTLNAVAGALNSGNTHNDNGIYYETSSVANQPNSSYWQVFNYTEQRNGTDTMSLSSAFVTNSMRNYSLPYLSWLEGLTYTVRNTGNGASSSNPFLINTAAQLKWALGGTSSVIHYSLLNDIDASLLGNYSAQNFAGNLHGNGKYILNLSSTLINTLSGSVSALGFEDVLTTGNILANSVTGSASQIYIKSAQGSVIGSGNIDNSLSNGATFVATATNCFNSNITDEQFVNLDKDIWVYDGSVGYTLRAFVENLGDNADSTSLIIAGSVITINNLTDLENAIAYISAYSGTYTLNFVGITDIDLQNRVFYIPTNSTVNITGLTTIRNGVIIRDSTNNFFANTANSINTIINCGIIVDNATSGIFGETSARYTNSTVTISDSVIIVGDNSTAVVFNSIENGAITINLSNLRIYSNTNKPVYLLANTAQNGAAITTNITNITAYNCELDYLLNTLSGEVAFTTSSANLSYGIVESNAGVLTVNLTSTNTSTLPLIATNNNQITINVNGGTIASNLITTNNGTATITLTNATVNTYVVDTNSTNATLTITATNSSLNNNALVNNNAGTLNLNVDGLNITGSGTGSLVNQNNGSITADVQNLTFAGFDTVATVANTSSGNIDLTVNSAVTLNATNSAGVAVNCTSGQITVTLNANLAVTGTTAGAIVLNGQASGITVTDNGYTITVNDEQIYPTPPEPEPEPEPEPGGETGGETGEDTGEVITP